MRAHVSECNGLVERLHRSVKESLMRQVHEWSNTEHAVDWVTLLPSVMHAYNSSVHKTTGFTPFMLQMGRPPRPLGPLQLQSRGPAPPSAVAGPGAGAGPGTGPGAETGMGPGTGPGAGTRTGTGGTAAGAGQELQVLGGTMHPCSASRRVTRRHPASQSS